jgi:hypothetical protein
MIRAYESSDVGVISSTCHADRQDIEFVLLWTIVWMTSWNARCWRHFTLPYVASENVGVGVLFQSQPVPEFANHNLGLGNPWVGGSSGIVVELKHILDK